jgi:hypothetical protein
MAAQANLLRAAETRLESLHGMVEDRKPRAQPLRCPGASVQKKHNR